MFDLIRESPRATCYIVPRHDLSSAEMTRLAAAIHDWLEEKAVSVSIVLGTEDLKEGELPTPKPVFPVKFGGDAEWIKEDMLRQAAASSPRGVYILLSVVAPVQHMINGLAADVLADEFRSALPTDLIEEILIDGESWNAIGEE